MTYDELLKMKREIEEFPENHSEIQKISAALGLNTHDIWWWHHIPGFSEAQRQECLGKINAHIHTFESGVFY